MFNSERNWQEEVEHDRGKRDVPVFGGQGIRHEVLLRETRAHGHAKA